MPHPIYKMARRRKLGPKSDYSAKIDVKKESQQWINRIFIRIEPFVLMVLWSAVIFYFSNIPGLRSEFQVTIDFIFRKAAHVLEYTLLFLLSYRASKRIFSNKKYALLSALFYSLFYAMSDEFHQTLVDNREGKTRDVLIDSVGISLGWIVLLVFKLRKKA